MIIPFFIPHSGCPHQCVFCNQKNITGQSRQPDLQLMPQAIEAHLKTVRPGDRVQIAFYGGSFTALPRESQAAYLEAAVPYVRSGRVERIRLSTRPDALSRDCLRFLKQNHVRTIELGVQSMNDDVLRLSNRGHAASDTVKAVGLLREHEFEIGLQLMPGLPGDSRAAFRQSVDKTINLGPDFVRIYPALVIKDTPLADLLRSGKYAPLALRDAVTWSKEALLGFEAAGIKVIRIGLQPTIELEKPGTIIAGPYHPAFRQLVESEILLDSMMSALAGRTDLPRSITFLVHPSDRSSASGQKRSNLRQLKERFGLAEIVVRPDCSVAKRTVQLSPA